MVARTDQDQLVLEDALGDELGVEQFANQGDLYFVVQNKLEYLVRMTTTDGEFHFGVFLCEFAQKPGQQIGTDRGRRTDRQRSRARCCEVRDEASALAHRLESAFRIGQKGATGRRQSHAAPRAEKERATDLSLEALQSSGQCRLRQKELGRDGAEITGTRDAYKGL